MKTFQLSFAFACLLALGAPSLARAQDQDGMAPPAAKATKTKAPATVDLGHLAAPGKEFLKAAEAKGVVTDGGLVLEPGQKVTFTSDRNQINGIASMASTNPEVTITSEIVKPMNKGKLGNMSTVEWTIALSPKATGATRAEITASADYMSRHDPAYNFKVGVATKTSNVVDLGHLGAPGKEFLKAAQDKGVADKSGLVLQPGQKVTFTSDRNQINGIASMASSNPEVTITSEVVKPMNKGQLGNMSTVEWTIALSPKATGATKAEITATSDYMSRHDPAYNFKVGVDVASAKTTAAADGVDARIRDRGGEKTGPKTGMDQVIDKRLADAKDASHDKDGR